MLNVAPIDLIGDAPAPAEISAEPILQFYVPVCTEKSVKGN